MARAVLSEFECDCGHVSPFGFGTVRECADRSPEKPVLLADSEPEEHTIVFRGGRAVQINCPRLEKVALPTAI